MALSGEETLAILDTLCTSDDEDAVERAHASLQAAPNQDELGGVIVQSGRIPQLLAKLADVDDELDPRDGVRVAARADRGRARQGVHVRRPADRARRRSTHSRSGSPD